jgi:formylglycine-generating enzyme required for sulfatase activity
MKSVFNYLFTPRYRLNRFQLNLVALVLLTVGFIFGSYFTINKIIKILALNDTTQTWLFNAGTASDYTAASTIMTVDLNGAHPSGGVDGANEITNPSFAANNTSWSLTASQSATNTPAGWAVVPGNSSFVATNSAFLAMKYEAKIVGKADGNIAYNSADVAESRADGTPWVNISQTESINECKALSVGGAANHLITNDEWMTIANNAEQLNANWTGAAIGSGYLFAGHNDNVPAKAIAASTTDTGNNRCAYTDDAGGTIEAPSPCPANTDNNTSGSSLNHGYQVRVLGLSSGANIWDFAGNVWEWTNDTVPANQQPTSWNGTTDYTTGDWSDYTSGSLARYLHSYITNSPVSQLKSEPTSSSYTHNAKYGIGRIWHYSLSSSSTAYAFLRGGNWDGTGYAGAFALYLGILRGDRSLYIGFRCASDPVAISQSWQSNTGRGAAGGNLVTIPSVVDAKLTQNINLGEAATYNFSAYVYDRTGAGGGAVSESVAQLYFNGAVVNPTTYTAVTGETGWYKLAGTVTSTATAVDYGLFIKAGKSVSVDDFTLSKQGTYSVFNKNGYYKSDVSSWDSFSPTVTNTGTNGSVVYQLCTDDLGDTAGVGQGTACEAQNKWKWWNGSAWVYATNSTTHTNTAAQLTQAVMQDSSLGTSSKKISVKAILSFGGVDYPKITSIAIGLTTDTTPPTNASGPLMNKENGGTCTNANNCWTKLAGPSFSWTAGSDTQSPTVWYCLYLGTDSAGDPAHAKGKLGDTSPVTIPTGWTCQFIVSSTSLDLSTAGYLKTALSNSDTFVTAANTYYLNIKAVDNGGNTPVSSVSLKFRYDGVVPTNVTSINPASGNFSNVADMNFSWPISPAVAASSDNESDVLGWQYQINPSVDTSGVPTSSWKGTTNSTDLNLDYIPATASAYTFVPSRDGDGSTAEVGKVSSGNNQIYFRTVDNAGNPSSNATIRTGSISFGGNAPSFGGTDSVTITPSTSTTNSFALSWPAATATTTKTVTHYYYMIKTTPPSTLATLQDNPSTYIDNGTATTVSAGALANVNKGSNTVYVVAIDNASTPNYSPSNYISGTFTLNSTTPDNVGNLVASDSSIKSQSQWNVTLTWTAPTYQGAGNLSYLVYRSADGTTFAQVGSSSGLSYVDSAPLSAKYYYKVYTKDGANATSSGTNAVSITPTGKWTSAPTLSTGPDAGSITTKKATITWTTSRTADSKISYGTSTGSYNSVEPSNSSQVSSHSIQLTGLSPGTTYYYKAKWTDEDGNTGTSDEKSFSTSSAPTAKNVSVTSIGLTSGLINYTVTNASSVKIYYGITSSFGGTTTVSTSTTETAYTTQLTALLDGTKYYYKINTFDSEGSEYEGTILDFTTLPRPKISKVQLQQVANTAQSTILITWTTNTEVSSIITYYPQGQTSDARDEVNVALTKGEHRMIIRSLLPQTDYILVVKGRDKIGNEASSDTQKFTTASDSRPPQISGLHVEGSNIPPTTTTAQESTAQLIVSWNSDELGTSQVEFGEGTGTTYSSKTQEDSNLTSNHLVIISNLTPSKVYHLRALSKDKAGNQGLSIDTVTITPKATENALNLVISNLQEVFGFIGNINK